MASDRCCDGVTRRDFLRVGVLGGTGLTLANYLEMARAGEVGGGRAKAAIFVCLRGGPTHMDTFDMKPDSSKEYRGELNPVRTNVPGVEICELLPKLARCADKYAILRGVSHNLAAHQFGTKYMVTGNRPLPSLEFPGYGSVVSSQLSGPPDLPKYVAIPDTPEVPGYLGISHAPFGTTVTPRGDRPFTVRGISLGRGLTVSQVTRRQELLADLDTAFDKYEKKNELLSGLDQFSRSAYRIISSKRAREAFDISKESKSIAGRFGDSAFAQSCLLACRLVEAGVRFVTISFGGWDTHQNNFERMKTLLPQLDDGMAGLFTTLSAKGLLESTSVLMTGEFGRTPKINQRAGRDHWPRAMFVLAGGGGMRGGQVIGASDENGMGPKNEAITPDMVGASLYHSLGIDYTKEFHTSTGRPVMIVRNGKVIPELFGERRLRSIQV